MSLPQIQETTIYPELVQHLKEQGFDAIGETKTITKQRPDILFKYSDVDFIIEVKIGEPNIRLRAIAQVLRYAQTLETFNVIVLVFPKDFSKQRLILENFTERVLNTKIFCFVSTAFWTENIECNFS